MENSNGKLFNSIGNFKIASKWFYPLVIGATPIWENPSHGKSPFLIGKPSISMDHHFLWFSRPSG